jgi:hypothetical protein
MLEAFRFLKYSFVAALFAVAALPFEAEAQGVGVSNPNVSRGNLLRKPEYQTYASLALFVDPTGNDNNACTATGTDACLTFQGAVSKVPKLVRHPVTIDSATGSYGPFLVDGFSFDAESVTAGAYLWFRGAYVAFVPATGTASGTATAGSAGTGSTFGTMSDGIQTWTVDNLKGQILEITGGTGVGQFRVIESNTATIITIVGTWTTSPVAGSTYAIRDWGTSITSAQVQPALPNFAGANATAIQVAGNTMIRQPGAAVLSANIYFERIKTAPGGANRGVAVAGGTQLVAFNQCRIEGGSLPALDVTNGSSARATTSYFFSSSSTINLGGGSSAGNLSGAYSFAFSMVETSGASASAISLNAAGMTFALGEVKTTGATSLAGVGLSGTAQNIQFNSNRVVCAAGSTTRGIRYVEAFSANSQSTFGGDTVAITNCATGIEAQGTFRVITSSVWAFNTLTTGILASKGAVVNLSSGSTFTTVTSEISIDGVVYTAAALNALTPPVITNLNYGTWVGR